MKLFSSKFRVVFIFVMFFVLANTYNVEAASKIKAGNVKEYVKSMGKIYEGMSVKETKEFMVAVNTLLFWEALQISAVESGGTIKELNEKIKTDKSISDFVKSSLVFVISQVTDLFASPEFNEAVLQQSLTEMDTALDALKESSKEGYEITLKAIKTLDGKTVKTVKKEADVILKRFEISK